MPALAALREGRVHYHPESQHAFAVRSLEEIPDWNVSRQLWWGHQLPIWYCPDGHVTCAWPPPASARSVARRARARSRRARHLVLVGALAVRDARLARGHGGPPPLLPGRRELDGARDHPALGEPDDLDRDRARRRRALPRRDHPLDRARPRRTADVEEPRHGRRSARDDRRVRRGRDALRPSEDVVHPGRALRRGRDRRGPQAGDQAVERRAPHSHERRGRRAGCAAAAPSRSGGSSRGSTPCGPRWRRRGSASTSPPP